MCFFGREKKGPFGWTSNGVIASAAGPLPEGEGVKPETRNPHKNSLQPLPSLRWQLSNLTAAKPCRFFYKSCATGASLPSMKFRNGGTQPMWLDGVAGQSVKVTNPCAPRACMAARVVVELA